MATAQNNIEALQQRIRELEEENASLRNRDGPHTDSSNQGAPPEEFDPVLESGLTKLEIERYSRQLLLRNGFGIAGQKKLLSAKVLVVGAGGIGSTVIPYLAACGVGHLTIADFDDVEVSNLHRQVIHRTSKVGRNKAECACELVADLNPAVTTGDIQIPISATNALEIVMGHDCVVDASDNPRTRYVINDACVLAGKPLVSGSAMGLEGQLTVYNYDGGPCYRCLYPKPNAAEGCKSCSDNGVLGPVPGLIGVLQAVEVLKIITGIGTVMSEKLIMYDALEASFLRISKPPRALKCPVCGPNTTIRSMNDSEQASMTTRGPSCKINGQQTPIAPVPTDVDATLQISCDDYSSLRARGVPHVLIDVRVPEQFALCSLDGAINIPLEQLVEQVQTFDILSNGKPIFCICRRGIASVAATKFLSTMSTIQSVTNIQGGLDVWRDTVDHSFPKY